MNKLDVLFEGPNKKSLLPLSKCALPKELLPPPGCEAAVGILPNGGSFSFVLATTPLNETKYAYEYNLPNFYISYFHPIDWFNQELINEYFIRSEHYKYIYASESCLDITNYVLDNNLDISYIFVKQNEIIDVENCQNLIYLFNEN